MKTNLKVLALSLSVAATLVASSDSWATPKVEKKGNGDSYSGPTLSGDAVAMKFDKPIKLIPLRNVLKDCIEKGNDLEKAFLNDFFAPTMTKTEHIDYYPVAVSPERFIKTKNIWIIQATINHEKNNFTPRTYNIFLTEKGLLIENQEKDQSFLIKDFPSIRYSEAKQIKNYYPTTGDYTHDDVQFKNLQIVYDIKSAEPYPLATNITTDQPTQLSAPVAEFANCMIDGLGKL